MLVDDNDEDDDDDDDNDDGTDDVDGNAHIQQERACKAAEELKWVGASKPCDNCNCHEDRWWPCAGDDDGEDNNGDDGEDAVDDGNYSKTMIEWIISALATITQATRFQDSSTTTRYVVE